ncbi:MAG: single-stranded-DNA-specific exonuclease RecJ [Cycloclasticus sp. symbiont of Bathymodiolus heckerae]|nr:MAG: single-stranded-DNA-specific exonuclease RecJ [Cycloclasticus sp. symbiont of Bathymodiolus heckerae]
MSGSASDSSIPRIKYREAAHHDANTLAEVHPVLRQVYLNRGITQQEQLDRTLKNLPSYQSLTGIESAVRIIKEAIQTNKKILIVADFDADGATSCAVAIRGLKMLGANNVDFVVPDRFKFGYGLTPEIVDVALELSPDLIITVDNGISSVEGVAYAIENGCQVVVTDHHLPPKKLPNAHAIVNPQLINDEFPSKALAGVGVMFYVLLALRASLKNDGVFEGQSAPNLANLLDIVALGTVADVVPMDETNRKLVHQGILRIQASQCVPGIAALLRIAKREPDRVVSSDLGFAIGPRLNAAGRLDDMSLGIRCLLTDNEQEALNIAEQLDMLNIERRSIEDDMKQDAYKILASFNVKENQQEQWGVCLFDEHWHQGVIGILASRIKEKLNRPVIAFAKADNGDVKGSARSIAGLHIRDTLDDVASQHPGLLKKFGGHAMAAGMSFAEKDLDTFKDAFNQAVKKRLNNQVPENVFLVDGEIPDNDINLNLAETLRQAGPWGQNFPEPIFVGVFNVSKACIVGQKHVKLELTTQNTNRKIDAIYFNVDNPDSVIGLAKVKVVYQLDVNTYMGRSNVQLMVRYLELVD